MKHLALYRKWRPQRFSELVGQEHISRTLLNAIRMDRLAHAYLFCGPRGTGKTSSARLLAKALNCSQPVDGEPCNVCSNCEEITAGHSLDVIEIDAASNRGIDSARDLREQVRFSASGGRYRVFIIDEFHMLTKEAFNALLKTLEEPPESVIFVLATTEPHEVLQTIVSRCQRFDFQRITPRHLKDHLQHVAQAEQIGVSDAALEAIARKANGGLRDGLSLLDQVQAIAAPGEPLPDVLVYQSLGLVQEEELLQIAHSLFHGEVEKLLATLRQLLEQGHDALQIVEELVQLLRHLTLAALPLEQLTLLGVPSHLAPAVQKLGKDLSRSAIVSALELLLRTGDRLHHCSQPDIWLEADLICLCLQGQQALLQRVEQLEQQVQSGEMPARAPRPARPTASDAQPPAARPAASAAPAPAAPVAPAYASPQPHPAPTSAPLSAPAPVTAPPAAPPAETPSPAPPAEVFSWDPAPAPSPRAPIDPQDISGLWRAFLQEVKAHQKPLIGFLLNGHLAEVDTARKSWVLEFRSRPHHERIKAKLKDGSLQGLLAPLMGENYGIDTRLNPEAEKKNEPPVAPSSPEPAPVATAPPARPAPPPQRAPEPPAAQPLPPAAAPSAPRTAPLPLAPKPLASGNGNGTRRPARNDEAPLHEPPPYSEDDGGMADLDFMPEFDAPAPPPDWLDEAEPAPVAAVPPTPAPVSEWDHPSLAADLLTADQKADLDADEEAPRPTGPNLQDVAELFKGKIIQVQH